MAGESWKINPRQGPLFPSHETNRPDRKGRTSYLSGQRDALSLQQSFFDELLFQGIGGLWELLFIKLNRSHLEINSRVKRFQIACIRNDL